MISFIDRFLKSRLFLCLRIGQFLLALAVFAFVALVPGDYIKDISTTDKSMHFIGNVLLMLSACVALMGRMKLVVLLLLLTPYSLLIEAGQWLSPGRHVDIKDVGANMAGLIAGYLLAHLIELIWGRLNQQNEPRIYREKRTSSLHD